MAFVDGFKRATDEGSLPEIAQYSPYYLPLNVLLLPKDQTFIIQFQVDRLRRPNNARVSWVLEIIALNTSDATRIQSRVYVCYLTYQQLLSVWFFPYKTTVVIRIM